MKFLVPILSHLIVNELKADDSSLFAEEGANHGKLKCRSILWKVV